MEMLSNKEIGARIRRQRKERRLTIQDLADIVGVQNSTISRYENGNFGKIKLPIIESIGVALHVNPAWLVGKSNNPHSFNCDKGFIWDEDLIKDPDNFKRLLSRCNTDLYYAPIFQIRLDHDFSIVDSDGHSEQFSVENSTSDTIDKMWSLLKAASQIPAEYLDMARIMLESIPKAPKDSKE